MLFLLLTDYIFFVDKKVFSRCLIGEFPHPLGFHSESNCVDLKGCLSAVIKVDVVRSSP